jgi:hypothetical protein
MPWPALRFDIILLRALVVGVGSCWSVAFIAIALFYQLQLYADGAMFSYAVAVEDVWAFHWHNISGRLSVFFFSLLPAETYVWMSGNPGAGIMFYAALFYAAPLAGLIGTFAADRSHDRSIFVYACCSTALLCPAGLWLSDRDVVRPCRVLADACRQPLCETNRRWNSARHHHDADTRLHP